MPLEFEHIEDWAKVQEHEFSNMIVLCANCHGRKGDKPGQIDKRSLRQYKANLALVNSRYGELERRLFEIFAENPGQRHITFGGVWTLQFRYALKDGLIAEVQPEGGRLYIQDFPTTQAFWLTDKGEEFIKRWRDALPID